MILYPAIDLQSGKCVRLLQGDFSCPVVYNDNPIDTAKKYAENGAKYLHVVDLDGAKNGKISQKELIISIQQESGLAIQAGGGIRNKKDIDFLLNNNISKIIIGSLAITQPELVTSFLQEFGPDKIILALDVRNINQDYIVATQGWQVSSQITLWDVLAFYQSFSLRQVICTDISRDGGLQGPNINLYQLCVQRYPALDFQASGGISSIDDLHALEKIPVGGAILGKALYEHKFSLAEAWEALS